ATKYARKYGKTTLQMALKQLGIKIPPFRKNDYEWNARILILWRIASIKFANCASGVIVVIRGEHTADDSIYLNFEKPRLMKSPAVTTIIELIRGEPPHYAK
ncbi:hypothetical protein BKA70DRAFT_1049289, partial [Coprinopsis sp. MPI-PUGE-AT-0042]